jgi:hypothetical protein
LLSLLSPPQLLGSGREIKSNRTAGDDVDDDDDDGVDDDVDPATSIKVTAAMMV